MKNTLSFVLTLIFTYSYCQSPSFIWPVKAMSDYDDMNDFYMTNNYVDHDPSTNRDDYICGNRTYDGHNGVDIDLWPFSWSMMQNNYVGVYAAADGTVSEVDDNNNNENNSVGCSTSGNSNNCGGSVPNVNWNHIEIIHANGYRTTYGHIRNNSSFVAENQIVKKGQLIALVGSSGCSSHPHLHFEVDSVNASGQRIKLLDPYFAPNGCNSLNSTSLWQNQKDYSEPNIIRVMTHYDIPSLIQDGPGGSGYCITDEQKRAKSDFNLGDQIVYGMAFRDISAGDIATLLVFNENESLVFTVPIVAPGNYKKWYTTVATQIPNNYSSGTYRVEVTYDGNTAVHYFTVNCPTTRTITTAISGHKGIKVSAQLNSSSMIATNSRVRFQSAGQIKLTNGFKATLGSSFKARIRDCNYSE